MSEEESLTPREEYELWMGLLNHPMWQRLEAYAEEQKTARMVNLLQGMDSLRLEDRERGEILGIGLFIQYPRTIAEALEVELDNISKE